MKEVISSGKEKSCCAVVVLALVAVAAGSVLCSEKAEAMLESAEEKAGLNFANPRHWKDREGDDMVAKLATVPTDKKKACRSLCFRGSYLLPSELVDVLKEIDNNWPLVTDIDLSCNLIGPWYDSYGQFLDALSELLLKRGELKVRFPGNTAADSIRNDVLELLKPSQLSRSESDLSKVCERCIVED